MWQSEGCSHGSGILPRLVINSMSCQERVLLNKFNKDYRFCSHSSSRIQSAQHNFLSPEFRQLMKEIWRQTDRGRAEEDGGERAAAARARHLWLRHHDQRNTHGQ